MPMPRTASRTSVDDARFEIDASGNVTVASGASFDAETEGSIDLTVTATSDDGSTSSETFSINVADVDEYDVSAVTDSDAAADTVAEDAAVGATVGVTASASDADATDGVSYSLSDDAGGLFAIDADTGVVTVAGAPSMPRRPQATTSPSSPPPMTAPPQVRPSPST